MRFTRPLFPMTLEDLDADWRLLSRLPPGTPFFGVASGGWTPLSMLARGWGPVHLADLNPHQVQWLRFQRAAIEGISDPSTRLQLFGQGGHPQIRALYHEAIRPRLERPRYWDRRWWWFRRQYPLHTVAGQGFWILRNAVRVLAGDKALNALLHAPDLQRQAQLYHEQIGPRVFTEPTLALMRQPLGLARFGIPGVQARKGAEQYVRYLAGSLDRQMRSTLLRDHWFWSMILAGRLLSPEGAPDWLQASRETTLRRQLPGLDLREGDLLTLLQRARPQGPVVLNVSDTLDWHAPQELGERVRGFVALLPPGSVLIQRSISAQQDLSPHSPALRRLGEDVQAAQAERTGCYPGYFWYSVES